MEHRRSEAPAACALVEDGATNGYDIKTQKGQSDKNAVQKEQKGTGKKRSQAEAVEEKT